MEYIIKNKKRSQLPQFSVNWPRRIHGLTGLYTSQVLNFATSVTQVFVKVLERASVNCTYKNFLNARNVLLRICSYIYTYLSGVCFPRPTKISLTVSFNFKKNPPQPSQDSFNVTRVVSTKFPQFLGRFGSSAMI